MQSIDLTILEQQFPEFRSEELYFIRLAGTYMQSIFWDVFDGKGSASVVSRRRKMKELAAQKIEDKPKNKELRAAILEPHIRWHQSLDCFKSDFKTFLEGLPKDMVDIFEEKLRRNHAVFLRYRQFLAMFEVLLQARGRLEHFEERQKKGAEKTYNDAKVIEAFGILLPPHFFNLFLGRVTVWQGKLKTKDEREKTQSSKIAMQALLTQITKERKENTKRLYAQERTRKNIKDKTKRHSYLDQNQKWYRAFLETSNQRKDDYRPFNFKIRYHFMGEQNFHAICKILDPENEGGLNFQRDIEPFYDLTTKVNLVLHCFLEKLPKNTKDKISTTCPVETEKLRTIRNTVAHNGLFWRVYEYDDQAKKSRHIPHYEVFQIILNAVKRECGKAAHDDLVHRLQQLFRKQKRAVADKREDQENQPKHIKPSQVKKYKAAGHEVDERAQVQKKVAQWMRALNRACA